jgi:anti-sigma B factor antagonist
MPLHAERMSDKIAMKLEGEMTIYHACELKEQMSEWLEQPQEIEMDLSGVSEIDSAGLQLLIAAKQASQAKGRSLHLLFHSQAVLDAIELCNLSGFFGDPTLLRYTLND